MSPKYDLFEKFPDGSSLWRACVIGLETARQHMQDLARRSSNQFYAMHVLSGKVVGPYLPCSELNSSVKTQNHGKAAAA
jgi:hypothetical protein